MIVWSKDLHCSKEIDQTKQVIMEKIEANQTARNIFCIAFSQNDDNLFDIYASKELRAPHYQRIPIFVVGLAKGKDEASELVRELVEECFRETGGFAVREYFK